MNIVDLVTSQLSGEVLGKIGGLIGASESQTRTASSAAVPALLGALGKLAASSGGAGQLAGALGGLDLGMLGNLVGALSGAGGSSIGTTGGSLLGSLLGNGGMGLLVKAVAAFAKMNPDMTRKLLGYLAPIVLGVIAKQFTGRPDAAGLTRLFSEQQTNISRAVPSGFSLADVSTPQQGGMPSWLPLAALVALAAAGWYLLNERGANDKERVEVVEEVVVTREEPVLPSAVTDALKVDTGVVKVGDDVTDLLAGLGTLLGGVTDVKSAEEALPKLRELAPSLESIQKDSDALPAAGKATIARIVSEGLGKLKSVIDTVMAIPGVKELLGPVVTPMVETLSKLGK